MLSHFLLWAGPPDFQVSGDNRIPSIATARTEEGEFVRF